jgi:hypothetical protein
LFSLGERVALGDLIDMRIDLLSGGDVRVAEDDLRVAGRDAELLDQ